MGDAKNTNYETAAFTFNSYESDVRLDVISTSPNLNPSYELKVCANDSKPISFAYQYGNGLMMLSKTNPKKHHNILGEFLKIKESDINGYLKFFNTYGFLFPVPIDRFIKFNPSIITNIAQRLRTIVDLIAEINNLNSTNVRKVMELSLFLLLGNEWELDIDGKTYTSKKFSVTDLIKFSAMDNIVEKNYNQEIINTGEFIINDSINGTVKIDSNEYNKIIDGYITTDGKDDPYYKRVVYLYANYFPKDKEERFIIDLLYNYYNSVGIPQSITADGISYYKRFNDTKCENLFSEIIEFAKYIIKHEIDNSIADIKPVYNQKSMRPDWCVGSLLSAIYFSLFFVDSNTETLRRRSKCGRYFLVNRSNSVKIYCDEYCRRNAQAAKHRMKIKSSK